MSKEIRDLEAELAKNTNDNALNRIKSNHKILRSLDLTLPTPRPEINLAFDLQLPEHI